MTTGVGAFLLRLGASCRQGAQRMGFSCQGWAGWFMEGWSLQEARMCLGWGCCGVCLRLPAPPSTGQSSRPREYAARAPRPWAVQPGLKCPIHAPLPSLPVMSLASCSGLRVRPLLPLPAADLGSLGQSLVSGLCDSDPWGRWELSGTSDCSSGCPTPPLCHPKAPASHPSN